MKINKLALSEIARRANLDEIQTFLSNEESLNTHHEAGCPLLSEVVRFGGQNKWPIVEYLLQQGKHFETEAGYSYSVFFHLVRHKKWDLIERGYQTPNNTLQRWLRNDLERSWDFFIFLIDKKNFEFFLTPQGDSIPFLQQLMDTRYFGLIGLILKAGFVHESASYNHPPFSHQLAFYQQWGLLELLIQNDANCNSKNFFGENLIFTLINNRQWALIELLIQKGVNPNSQDSAGNPLIHCLLSHPRSPKKLIDLLLSQPQIDLHIKDSRGNTPLHEAIYSLNSSVIKTLIEYKAHWTVPNNTQKTPLDLLLQYKEQFDSDIQVVIRTIETQIERIEKRWTIDKQSATGWLQQSPGEKFWVYGGLFKRDYSNPDTNSGKDSPLTHLPQELLDFISNYVSHRFSIEQKEKILNNSFLESSRKRNPFT